MQTLWMIFRNHHHLEMIRLHLAPAVPKPLDCHRLTQQLPLQNIPNSLPPEIPSTSNYDAANTITPADKGNSISNLQESKFSLGFTGMSSQEICESAKKLYWGAVQVDYLEYINTLQNLPIVENAEAARYLGIMYL